MRKPNYEDNRPIAICARCNIAIDLWKLRQQNPNALLHALDSGTIHAGLAHKDRPRDIIREIKKYGDTLNNIRKRQLEAALLDSACQSGGNIYDGDFRVVLPRVREDNSVDMFVVDMPWTMEFVALHEDAAKLAAAKLQPGGWFLIYMGRDFFWEASDLLRKHLVPQDLICILYPHRKSIRYHKMSGNHWQPVLLFVKPPLRKRPTVYSDLIDADGNHEFRLLRGICG